MEHEHSCTVEGASPYCVACYPELLELAAPGCDRCGGTLGAGHKLNSATRKGGLCGPCWASVRPRMDRWS